MLPLIWSTLNKLVLPLPTNTASSALLNVRLRDGRACGIERERHVVTPLSVSVNKEPVVAPASNAKICDSAAGTGTTGPSPLNRKASVPGDAKLGVTVATVLPEPLRSVVTVAPPLALIGVEARFVLAKLPAEVIRKLSASGSGVDGLTRKLPGP